MSEQFTQSTLVRPEPFDRFSGAHLAAAGFLARYSGRTREAYAADLRGYLTWCSARQLDVFTATRPHIEVTCAGSRKNATWHRRPWPADCLP